MTVSLITMLLRILALILAVYIGLCLFLYWRQETMLFFPERSTFEQIKREAEAEGFKFWPGGTKKYRALLAEPVGTAKATCIIWHGNAGSAQQRGYLVKPLLKLGVRVVVAEYAGYGARPPTGGLREGSLTAEAKTLAKDIQRQFGGPLILLGESLGASVAAAVAGDVSQQHISGLILITPWHDLGAVARRHYPWLPVNLLLRDRYDNAAAAQDYLGPCVVLVAGADEIIPPAEGRRLYQELMTHRKRLVELSGAHHNDWADRVTLSHWKGWLDFITTER